MALYQLDERVPQVHESAYVAESAELIGSVVVEAGATIWSNVVIRGDNETITIGRHSNVQEGSVLHTDPGFPLVVGEHVTVGHQAMLHGCTIEDGALIGIQAVVLNGARIGRGSLVGAGALVTEGKAFGEGQLILGSPARAVRPLAEEDRARMQRSAANYVERGRRYRTALKRVG
jgi:carbonic anhydrase/acetyltransferase-like protein (isoleucine patch superfamily)